MRGRELRGHGQTHWEAELWCPVVNFLSPDHQHLDTSTFCFLQTFLCGRIPKFQLEISQKGQRGHCRFSVGSSMGRELVTLQPGDGGNIAEALSAVRFPQKEMNNVKGGA